MGHRVELSQSKLDVLQVVFTATACGTAGDAGTTRWPELAPSFLVRLTSQDLTHDVSVNAQLVHVYTLIYAVYWSACSLRVLLLNDKTHAGKRKASDRLRQRTVLLPTEHYISHLCLAITALSVNE